MKFKASYEVFGLYASPHVRGIECKADNVEFAFRVCNGSTFTIGFDLEIRSYQWAFKYNLGFIDLIWIIWIPRY